MLTPRLASALLASLLVCLGLSACGGGAGSGECEDEIDNDGDGLIDDADPACQAGRSREADDPAPQCSNGRDDDNDGLIDFPNDPGCDDPNDNDEFGSGLPDCDDGRDNDGDGFIDYPDDPGCLVPNQDSEVDDCPSGPNCPECGDGIDNDFDGATDYAGGDPNCTSAADDSELDISANACGQGTAVLPLPASGMVSGTLGTGISNLMPVLCTGAVGTGTETAYVVTVSTPQTLVATTDDPATTADTVLYLRRACMNTTSELACNNDIDLTNNRSTLTVSVQPGTYFLIVDARGPASSGGYVLRVTRFPALGDTCTMESDCAPLHVCRTPAGGTGTSCELPVCSDGRDDDMDGHVDFPFDPGCTSALDDDEADSCPSGVDCPACGNGMDDDGDGQTDYPADTSCTSASAPSEFNCQGADPIRLFTGNVTGQTTAGLANDLQLTCGLNGRDEVWLLRVGAALAEIRIDTIGSTIDTALALRRGSCNGFDLQCDDDGAGSGDSQLYLVDVDVGDYYIVVDDKNSTGTYNLNVSGVWANGADCDPLSTAFHCGPGYKCVGVPQATCIPVACNDTIDEDGDGFNGFPDDPGCSDTSDDDETDTCPAGPGCPECANQLDDDGDGFTDYPADPGCGFAGQASELAPCTSLDPVMPFTANLSNVTGIGSRLNDVALSCGTNGRDDIYRLIVPVPLTNLRIDTLGSPLDTVVGVRVGSCNGTDLACDDNTAGNGDSLINLNNVSVGEYFIIVEDRFVSGPGPYNLNVRGTLGVGASCNPSSQLFVCPTAHACIGAPGAETCQPAACNDAIDQDGDGFPGYPTDPGCTDVSDPDESDDCPSGPGCPACGNGVDDDGDGWADYPQDPGCTAASDTSEIECVMADPLRTATATVTGQVTTGLTNDFALSCGANGRDEVYRLVINRLVTNLRVDTIGSALDAVVAVRRSTCAGADLACNDNGGGGTAALVNLPNPAFGEYFIIVDDRNSSNSTYTLNIRATLPIGAACNPADSLYVCPAAYVCGGAAGSETCRPGPCNDDIDDDGAGDGTRYPDDPGCSSIEDLDESDDCPSGPMCPLCSNGVDDDFDGFTDYPADPTCSAASDNVEAAVCSSADPILAFTGNVTGATMNTRLNDIALSCGTNGRDEIYRLLVDRPLARLRVDTIGSALDTVVGVRRTNCNGTDLACDDNGAGSGDSLVVLNNVPRGEYFVIVDDRNTTGAYNLNIVGELPAGAACVPASTTFPCTAGYKCAGAGAQTCVPTACNDLIDADGDGRNGYPDDPGCTDISDDDETDTCPAGPGCPACANGIDDDGDGLIDYPNDTGCVAASSLTEFTCVGERDPITIITAGVTTGTNVGANNDFTPTCQSSNGPEVGFALILPVPVQTLTIDTEGSSPLTDTILTLMDQSCGSVIECDDDDGTGFLSLITRTNVAAGTYFILVDGYGGGTGGFTLNVRGTVGPGNACTSPLFASGLLQCSGTCAAGMCQ